MSVRVRNQDLGSQGTKLATKRGLKQNLRRSKRLGQLRCAKGPDGSKYTGTNGAKGLAGVTCTVRAGAQGPAGGRTTVSMPDECCESDKEYMV